LIDPSTLFVFSLDRKPEIGKEMSGHVGPPKDTNSDCFGRSLGLNNPLEKSAVFGINRFCRMFASYLR
jgi:hypothetical protein